MSLLMKKPYCFSIFILLLLFIIKTSYCDSQAIYMEDNRKHLCDVPTDAIFTNKDYMDLGRSICLIVHKSVISELWANGTGNPVKYPAGGVNLKMYGYLQDFIYDNLQPDPNTKLPVSSSIKFYNEWIADGGIYEAGTGVLIGDRQILTVDHIFQKYDGTPVDPSEYVAIFNWTKTDFNDVVLVGGAYCKNFSPYNYFRIVGYDNYYGETQKQIKIPGTQDRLDLSIIKTDRIFDKDIVALNVYTSSTVKDDLKGKELFTIGHGQLLPLIFSDNAFVKPDISFQQAQNMIHNLTDNNALLTNNQYNRLLFANLDGFQGNSGSPIFVKDKNLEWNVVGIYKGGEIDFRKSDDGTKIVENFYTKNQFENGSKAEYFQTLQDLRFNKYCSTDCDYIQIPEGGVNPLRRGELICATLPVGDFTDGAYLVQFNSTTGARVIYFQGKPDIRTVCKVVEDGASYNLQLIKLSNFRSISLNTSGIAHGDVLGKALATENDPSLEGGDMNIVNFIANIHEGDIPLYVTFDPIIPNNNPVSSFNWEFGDGTTSNQMYPTHIYTNPGTYFAKMTATINGIPYSYTSNSGITVTNRISSFSNAMTTNSNQPIFIDSVNAKNQTDPITCIAKSKINIYPNTILQGTKINLKVY